MANLRSIPATAVVVKILQLDPTVRYRPAANGVYPDPLDPVVKSICQPADLWLVVGMVGKVRSIQSYSETPVTAATVDHWFDRRQCAYDYDEITVNVVNRMNRNKNQIFKNAKCIVRGILGVAWVDLAFPIHGLEMRVSKSSAASTNKTPSLPFQHCWLVQQRRV